MATEQASAHRAGCAGPLAIRDRRHTGSVGIALPLRADMIFGNNKGADGASVTLRSTWRTHHAVAEALHLICHLWPASPSHGRIPNSSRCSTCCGEPKVWQSRHHEGDRLAAKRLLPGVSIQERRLAAETQQSIPKIVARTGSSLGNRQRAAMKAIVSKPSVTPAG
jgi:hypothetical protein